MAIKTVASTAATLVGSEKQSVWEEGEQETGVMEEDSGECKKSHAKPDQRTQCPNSSRICIRKRSRSYVLES